MYCKTINRCSRKQIKIAIIGDTRPTSRMDVYFHLAQEVGLDITPWLYSPPCPSRKPMLKTSDDKERIAAAKAKRDRRNAKRLEIAKERR